jgi:hypothetical protein
MAITVSGGIPTAFVDTFKDDLYHVCQQKKSLFENAVATEPVAGMESKAMDIMGQLEMLAKEGRNPETPRNDVSLQRRWLFHDPYHNALQFDKDDDLEMKLAPAGQAVKALRMGRNRKVDDIVLEIFEMTVNSGRRNNTSTITWSGQDGNTKYTTSSGGRTIPHDCSEGNCSSSDTGMTVEKTELVIEYFNNNNVDQDIPIWGAISPRQATQLFGQEEYINIDYNNDKPMTRGRVLAFWMGINWIVSPKIVIGSSNDVDGDTNVYECWFWAQDAVVLGVADSITVQISDRADLSHAQQVYVHMNMGGLRMDEDKVIKVECQ